MTIEGLVAQARQDGASDIHLICGLPPKYRKDGQIENMSDEVLDERECLRLARDLAGTDEAFKTLMETGELDAAATFAGSRCRIHIFKQQGVPSVALRLLREEIPDLTKLGLPPAALELPNQHKGIVLVTGETGSGKSTSLAAMIDYVNHHRKAHIVTLEDPVEYLYKPDMCAINQREVGKDTRSFSEGLRASLREDPNVILIGEMRDKDTIETAITAAETGHLVFGTLHTGSASDAVDRIVQVFPEAMQTQIRLQLSMCLQAVLTQQLVPKKGGGRCLACELMIVTDAIRNLIRAGNTPQIANAIATSSAIGGQTMDQALVRLVRSGQITRDVAMQYAHDRAFVQKNAI
ncbi:MAG: PilT/PilU family type 4a pilus ATPase [Oscillospiraceae bacterium]|nr:PilT/PilU family type 4a pilus ATPase [Oscillospiraceae bacterium]